MDIPLELVEQFARGNGAIFVGSDLSQGAGLPNFSQLINQLRTELDDCPPDADDRDIAYYYDLEYGRHRLVQKLCDHLDSINATPTPVYTELCKLSISPIFTTNYDDLLDQALRSAGQRFTPVVNDVDANFWSADRLQLVKLYGDLNQPETTVITTEDYERFGTQRPALARLLATTLQTRTALFLGYSVTDPALRLILRQVRDESEQFARNLYTVQFGLPRLSAKDLERRGLKVIDLDQQSDFKTQNQILLEWLQTLNKQVAIETANIKHAAPKAPQTAAEVLADEIQIWLRAMGYTITVQLGDAHSVDLDATLQRGLEEQHVLVRCVAGEITVSRLEALNNHINARNISKGWAISDRQVPPSAHTYATTNPNPSVRPFTLSGFVSQIFGPYFDNLRRLVEESDILQYYVDLACYRRVLDSHGKEVGRDNYDVIDAYVDDWLKAREANHLSVLGEFGSGKTWFCRHYAYRQLERYLADPVRERLPILITLRDFVKQVDVGSLIRKLLDEQGVRLAGGLEAFEELNRQGKLLLIFDGFDEMALKVDYQTVVDNFWELAKVVVSGSKVLLTCRTGYFRYADEAEKVMRGEELGRKMIVIKPPQFNVIHLKPFTDAQLQEVITRRHGAEVAQTILTNSGLVELARQPVVIEMLLEALPNIKPDTPFNISEIYRLAVGRWLKRDIATGRTFMSKQDKLFFMMELAWEMFSTEKLKIHYKELPNRISRHFGLIKQDERDHYDYDIRTKSFLQRDADGYYQFSHRSLVEFLVALKIYKEFEKVELNSSLSELLLTYVKHEISGDDLPGDLKEGPLHKISTNSDEEIVEEIDLSWGPIIMFLWNLGPVGKQSIEEFMRTEEGRYFFTANLGMLESIGRMRDKEAIPLLLKCLICFYELAEDRIDRHTWRHATLIEGTVFEALENLKYEHLEFFRETPRWATEDGDCAPIAGGLAHAMIKALSENRINDANLLSEFISTLRKFNRTTNEGGLVGQSDFSLLEKDDNAVQRITDAVSKQQISEAIGILKKAYELDPQEFFELEPRQQLIFLERLESVVASEAMLVLLSDYYELSADPQVRLAVETIRYSLAKTLYQQNKNRVDDLLEQLRSPKWCKRWEAAYILGDFGDSTSVRALDAALKQETDDLVRKIGAVAIRKINRRLHENSNLLSQRDK